MTDKALQHSDGRPFSAIEFIKTSAAKSRADELLGKRAPQFVASVTAMLNADNKLANCEPISLFMAAVTAAALDLPINKNLAFAHIVPYENKKAGVTEAQFQLGWKGYVQLAQRSGQYKTISATPVYQGQLVAEDPLAGNTYDWTVKPEGEPIGYVAFFRLVTGFEKDFYMSMESMIAHATRYSKAYQWDNSSKNKYGANSPWSTNFDAMALKTVVKLLISRWGPMSVEMQKAVTVDSSIINEEGEPDYIDGNENLADVKADDEKKAAIIAANSDASENQDSDTPEEESITDDTPPEQEYIKPTAPKKEEKPKVDIKAEAEKRGWTKKKPADADDHKGNLKQAGLIDDSDS